MRILRALGAALLWLLAVVIGLVGCLLCITIILLPLGLLLLRLAGQLFSTAARLMLPRPLAHPGKELSKRADAGRKGARKAGRRGRKHVRRTKAKLAKV
jgi:hypothetical protein